MERHDALMDVEIERFNKVLRSWTDPTIVVLRGHLYSESILERLIVHELPRGDRLVEEAGLSYRQKLAIGDALNIIPDNIITFLRNLNRLRNALAHEMEKEIGDDDVERLCRPLGREYSSSREKALVDSSSIADPHSRALFVRLVVLRQSLAWSCGYVYGLTLGPARQSENVEGVT